MTVLYLTYRVNRAACTFVYMKALKLETLQNVKKLNWNLCVYDSLIAIQTYNDATEIKKCVLEVIYIIGMNDMIDIIGVLKIVLDRFAID